MSARPMYRDGIFVDAEHGGILCLEEEQLIHIIKKEPISNVYHVEQTPFARGKFAAVRKCRHQQTGCEYAAKFIRKRRRAMDQRKDIIHEVAVLRLASSNPHIVSLHEVYETASEMVLVLEMASGGELQRVLDVQDGLEEAKAVEFMRQILQGLCFLHQHNIAHLDLKPQNLLLTGEYPECDVKLCDFGISRVIQSGIEVREILGTPDYVAPEILSYEPITLATDIWSVGVLAYVLLSGFSPFGGETKQETFLNISQCSLTFPDDLFSGVSSRAESFVRDTLQVEPKKRLTAHQCLAHPWLAHSTIMAEIGGIAPSEKFKGGAEKVTVVEMSQDLGDTVVDSTYAEIESSQCYEKNQNINTVVEFSTHVEVNSIVTRMSQDSENIQHINANIEICTSHEVNGTIVQMSQETDCRPNGVFDKVYSDNFEEESQKIVEMSQEIEYDIALNRVNGSPKCCSNYEERVTVVDNIDLGEVTVHLECCKGYKERRTVLEMSRDNVDATISRDILESDEDLPVQKRPKNCCDGCCLSYPVAQCCNLHVSPKVTLNASVAATTSDQTVLC